MKGKLKVIVFDVPAVDSGALAILNEFFNFAVKNESIGIEWLFVVSTDVLECKQSSRVHVKRFPHVKRSWFHRICFEFFTAPRLVRIFGADRILSLQNLAVLRTKIPQIVYVHQALPYAERHFSYFQKYERFLALYSDILRPLIRFSVKKAIGVVVQTTWFRDLLVKKYAIDPSRIFVIPPSVQLIFHKHVAKRVHDRFFYPATPYIYKNFELIVSATQLLVYKGLKPSIILTIAGDENSYARFLVKRINKLRLGDFFILTGRLPHDEVVNLYRSTTLLFTSRLESFPMPLLEARTALARIIVTNTPFAHEILDDYEDATFCDLDDAHDLFRAMKTVMCDTGSIANTESRPPETAEFQHDSSWEKLITILY
jgi:glycosyltransferase involved in cell wall biosynthesis